MTTRRLEIFVIVAVIALVGIIYAFTQKPVLAPTNNITKDQNTPNPATSVRPNSEIPPPQQVPTSAIEYKGVDGKNALELLKANHNVEAKTYSFGSFITGIDGIQPDSSHFWGLYINDQFSQVAADNYATKSTDNIKWQIDVVKQ